MQTPTRRRFLECLLAGAAATGACGLLAPAAWARSPAIIVGGGPAGAGAALALRQAQPDTPVLMIERDPTRLGRSPALAFDQPAAGPDLDMLRRAGVEVVLDDVVDLDWKAARIELFSGRRLAFDRLFMAPGSAALDEAIPGLDPRTRHLWPAAWGNLREARRLRAQLASLPGTGHVVLRLPATISHPEAALGRALDLAALLSRTRPDSRLTVLEGSRGTDLAARFQSELARQRLHLGTEWLDGANGGTVLRVDAARGEIETDAGRLRADVVNFVGHQGAGPIARTAGLTDDSGWCPTDPRGRSTRHPEAVILGDARKAARRTIADALLSARAAASA
ncbi:FAD-dependent oxidoreductase [Rhodovulum strictum]|uniref:Sulfide dehydrogenase n=1 Tax=Rhodovulum strictum TaxID=58314 RepID=A0A844BJD9_9RHOB|nr:FAD-dependent oxidoreductase [Rhodovulum strictum]MRH22578.1 sulfide dehydrogenase [Rhodovulum strictum]